LGAAAIGLVIAACGPVAETGVEVDSIVTSSPAPTASTTSASSAPTTPQAPTSTTPTDVECPSIPSESLTREEILGEYAAPGIQALINVTLIDGTGDSVLEDAVVVIEDGVISAVGSADKVAVPEGASVFDALGGTVLPGLVDTHVHTLHFLGFHEGLVDNVSAGLHLVRPLENGLTTIRDLGSEFGLGIPVSAVRSAFDDLGNSAPNLVISGPFITRAGSPFLSGIFEGLGLGVADPAAAAAAVDALLDEGVDQIKIIIDDSRGGGENVSLTHEQVASIVAAAHARNVRVVAHVTDIEGAWAALANCVDEFAHWPGDQRLPEELIETMVDNDVPVAAFTGIEPFEGDVRRFLDAGGVVVLASDGPWGSSIGDELKLMLDSGMTPMEAIVASTRDAANAVGVGEHVGTIEPGKVADLFVTGGDPLTDLDAIFEVTAVFRRGHQLTPKE
jgi:imidazolonepropionase-like amidohydrolase